jgi:hypothetical protein
MTKSVFPRCTKPFYYHLTKAVMKDHFLEFRNPIPVSRQASLFIRDCYVRLADEIIARNGHAILTGTPGTGKSLFSFYLLFRLVQMKQKVIFHNHNDIIYFDGNQNVFEVRKTEDFKLLGGWKFFDGNIWCLFETDFQQKSDLVKYPAEQCKIFVSTCPDKNIVFDLQQEEGATTFYMPVWSKEEISMLVTEHYPKAFDWETRFLMIGGIPRYVLDKKNLDCFHTIKSSVGPFDLNRCLSCPNLDSDASSIHLLVHMQSQPPFTEYGKIFATDFVEFWICKYYRYQARRDFRSLLIECYKDEPWTKSLLRRIFRDYAIELIESGFEGKVRKLYGAGSRKEKRLVIGQPSRTVIRHKTEPGQEPETLYLPVSEAYADAWIPSFGVFKVSLAGTGTTGVNGWIEDMQLAGIKRVYWLLPETVYLSFEGVKIEGLEQYAVLVPYPKNR